MNFPYLYRLIFFFTDELLDNLKKAGNIKLNNEVAPKTSNLSPNSKLNGKAGVSFKEISNKEKKKQVNI